MRYLFHTPNTQKEVHSPKKFFRLAQRGRKLMTAFIILVTLCWGLTILPGSSLLRHYLDETVLDRDAATKNGFWLTVFVLPETIMEYIDENIF